MHEPQSHLVAWPPTYQPRCASLDAVMHAGAIERVLWRVAEIDR